MRGSEFTLYSPRCGSTEVNWQVFAASSRVPKSVSRTNSKRTGSRGAEQRVHAHQREAQAGVVRRARVRRLQHRRRLQQQPGKGRNTQRALSFTPRELSASPSELLASPREISQRHPARALSVTQRELSASPSESS
jgi:hypothetical protein